MENQNLISLYESTLELYNISKDEIKIEPDKLLAMLLLVDKKNFESFTFDNYKFYNHNKCIIDEKINKIIFDFNISEQNIGDIIEGKNVINIKSKYHYNLIWYVFKEGFLSLMWGINFHKELTSEEIFENYFGPGGILETKKTKKLINIK